MSHFNLIDEAWIPVRYPDGRYGELSLRDTLLNATNLATIEDPSPLVTAALHRLLLAVLYRALEGPTDFEQAEDLFLEGFSNDKINRYLDQWHGRFDLFDEAYPFFQIPNYSPKADKKGNREWRSWSALAAEHNADNAKVLFDHLQVSAAGSIPASQAARWLLACQTFALGGGNSDFCYTKSALSATAVMVLPLGNNLNDTLCLSLVPESQEVWQQDLPIWERSPDTVEALKKGPKQPVGGIAELYTWRTRSIRLNPSEGSVVGEIAFASGVACKTEGFTDPLLSYRIDEKKGRLPLQFRPRGLWRDFDSLLPGDGGHAPQVIHHAVRLTSSDQHRFPQAVTVLGQANNKAKIDFWRMERFVLPAALAGRGDVRRIVRTSLDTAETTQKSLWAACATYASNLISRGERDPDKKTVRQMVEQLPAVPHYWATLEVRFRNLLRDFTLQREEDDIHHDWLVAVRDALQAAWDHHVATLSTGNAWALRALAKAETPIQKKLRELNQAIIELAPPKEDL